MVPRPFRSPKWKDLIKPFQEELWLAVIVCLMITLTFVTMVSYLMPEIGISPYDANLYIVSLIFDESANYTQRMR